MRGFPRDLTSEILEGAKPQKEERAEAIEQVFDKAFALSRRGVEFLAVLCGLCAPTFIWLQRNPAAHASRRA